jgi:hypothetical protein
MSFFTSLVPPFAYQPSLSDWHFFLERGRQQAPSPMMANDSRNFEKA